MSLFGFGDVKPGDVDSAWGDIGPVGTWQSNLQDLGYSVEATGTYDDATWSATVAFKESVGLPANGVVDAATKAAMDQALAQIDQPTVVINPGKQGAINIFGQFEKLNWWVVGGVLAAAAGAYYWSRR